MWSNMLTPLYNYLYQTFLLEHLCAALSIKMSHRVLLVSYHIILQVLPCTTVTAHYQKINSYFEFELSGKWT
jgi:hypothetical protein